MKLLANHKLNARQLRAVELTEHILNSFEFEAWFTRYRFADMVNPPSLMNVEVIHLMFNRQQYRFSWELEKRPFRKRLFDRKTTGYTVANVITTYSDSFDAASMPELCRIFARQLMHVMSFDERDERVEPNRSIPFQVGEYVYASACRLTKMDE